MKKIVILGCENSHAAAFLTLIRDVEKYRDVEVVGVYSDEPAAQEKTCADFGVPAMADYAEAAGKVDGVIITARHGANHWKFAQPYIRENQVMFIDKPITVSEKDALTMARALRENEVFFTGGSSCRHEANVIRLREESLNAVNGRTIGGFVRCPINMNNEYGGFYFYAQHLVEIVAEIFGRYPKSVRAYQNQNILTVVFRYADFDVIGEFVDGNYTYYALRSAEKGVSSSLLTINSDCYQPEFDGFYEMLSGRRGSSMPLSDFIAPVFVLNAIERSMQSGAEEAVREFSV